MADTVVIGIGNTIKSDDGVGVHVLRRLQGMVGDDVDLVEGSVYCADLFGALEGKKKAVFVDALEAEEEPGSIFRFSPGEVRQKASVPLSIHDFGLYELIRTADLMGQCPEDVVIFAVQVEHTEFGEELTEAVSAAVDRVCELVLDELGLSYGGDREGR